MTPVTAGLSSISFESWSLVICVFRVTLFTLVGAAIHLVLGRRGPAAAAWGAGAALFGAGAITLLSLGPWPAALRIPIPGNRPAPTAGSPGQVAMPTELPVRAAPGAQVLGGERPPLLGDTPRATTTEAPSPTAWYEALADWPWGYLLAGVLLAGTLFALSRLLVGLLAIRSCRRRARAIDDRELRSLADDISARLGLARSCELAVSSEVSSPATVGWRRPLVLFPADWPSWTDTERRAVLAHELAHVRRGDYPTWVAALAIRAIHIYHPLVHWLVARLRLQQEMAADALAMPLAGGRHEYLLTLARMTLDYDGRLAGPARAFLPSSGTLFRRIEMLSNQQSEVSVRRSFTGGTRLATFALLAICALLIVAFRGPANEVAAEPLLSGNLTTMNLDFTDLHLDGISGEVGLVATLRPAELFSTPEFRDRLTMTPLRVAAALTPEQVACLTVASSPPGSVARTLPELPLATDQAVLVMKAPVDWRALFAASQADAVARPLADGAESFEFKNFPEYAAYAPSKRLLYVAHKATGRIPELIDKGPRKVSTPWQEALLREVASPLVLVVPGQTVRGIPAGAAITVNRNAQTNTLEGSLTTGDPVMNSVGALAVGLKLGVMTTRRAPDQGLLIKLIYENEQAAEQAQAKGEPQLKLAAAVLDMAVQQFAKAGAGLPPAAKPADAEIQKTRRMFETMRRFCAGYQLTRQDDQLEITTDVEFAQLTDVPQAVDAGRTAAARQRSMNHLKQIMLAMHNLHDLKGGFPAAAIQSADGKPLLSWRVALLPLLEQEALYKQFHLDEPWDSEHNKKLLDKMPDVYRATTAPGEPQATTTSVLALVGTHAALEPGRPRKLREITDGTSNTITVIEMKTNIPWTKPEDLPFDPSKDLPKIEGYHPGGGGTGFVAGFADGHVRFVSPNVDAELLKKLMTIDGREPVSLP
ncbi:MAG: DUF1559 domain-containing protein [Planctomycetaceae bacterium]|nr:DUF1559 domain-containing protein [Planctomycetaceae bacterium]